MWNEIGFDFVLLKIGLSTCTIHNMLADNLHKSNTIDKK